MGVADVGDDGDVRLYHLGEILNFPKVVHAGFNHRRLVFRRQAQKGQGGPHVVVVVLRGFPDLELRPQHGGDHLLGGGLSHTAGDLNHRNGKPVPIRRGQGFEGQAGVGHLNVKFVLPEGFRHSGAEAPGGAGGQGPVDKVVSVKPLSHPGQEKAAGGQLAAVGADRRDGGGVLAGV